MPLAVRIVRRCERITTKIEAYVIHIALSESFSPLGVYVVEHLVQEDDFALELIQLCQGLCTIIGLCVRICAGKSLHEFLRGRQVSRSTSPDEFLQLRGLCFSILRLQLIS